MFSSFFNCKLALIKSLKFYEKKRKNIIYSKEYKQNYIDKKIYFFHLLHLKI